jgi:hypothetical protein
MKKTIIYLDDYILEQAKKFAIDKNKLLQDVINEALKLYLKNRNEIHKSKVLFRDYHMGKIKGKLTRDELYNDI